MQDAPYEYNLTREIELPGGGRTRIRISSPSPINPDDYPILRPSAIQATAEAVVNIGNFVRPPDSKEITLEP